MLRPRPQPQIPPQGQEPFHGFDKDAGRHGPFVGGPGGRVTWPRIGDGGHRQAGVLKRIGVVVFGPVCVLDEDLAIGAGHDARSGVTAPQWPGKRVAVAAEGVAERHRACRFQDERAARAESPGDLGACTPHLARCAYLDEDVQADRAVNRCVRQRDRAVGVQEAHPVQFPR